MSQVILHDKEGDKLCHWSGSEKMIELAPSNDKALIDLPDARHELFANDPRLVLKHTDAFIQSHLGFADVLSARNEASYHEVANARNEQIDLAKKGKPKMNTLKSSGLIDR